MAVFRVPAQDRQGALNAVLQSDLAPVAQTTAVSYVVAVPADLPVRSIAELVALARAKEFRAVATRCDETAAVFRLGILVAATFDRLGARQALAAAAPAPYMDRAGLPGSSGRSSPGPISILRELALSGPWSGYLAPTCCSRPWEDDTPTAMVAPHSSIPSPRPCPLRRP